MKLSAYELFVVFMYGDYEVNEIFTTREEAEEVAEEQNDLYSKMVFSDNKRPYKVVTLYDAIWEIKDNERYTTELRCNDPYFEG